MSETTNALEGELARRLVLDATGTQLAPLEGLRAALGARARLWIKRDDVMSCGLGGNKLRKLELLLYDARAAGATAVGSIGGPTSNHLRLVAAAALRLGFAPFAFVIGDPDPAQGGNPLLLQLLGASVHGVSAERGNRDAETEARARFDEQCNARGLNGFWITFGGASLRGDLGYVVATREIVDQLGRPPRAIYTALGTGGTAVGLAAGAALYCPDAEVVGCAVMPKGAQVFSGLPSVALQLSRLTDWLRQLGATIAAPRLRIEHGQVGKGYAHPTDAAQHAIELLARTESIFLDPVYTGKALAGLLEDLRSGRFGDGDDIVFVHTGGLPGLFFRSTAT